MDYRPLIEEAMKAQHFATRYKLAKALGYSQASAIYQIERGKAGMSAEKLTKLLQLAGRLAVLWTLGALLFCSQTPDSLAKQPPKPREHCVLC